MRFVSLLGCFALASGCAALTGLDGDYQLVGTGGASAASGTGAGGDGTDAASTGSAVVSSTMTSTGSSATGACPDGLAGEGTEASPCLVTTCEDLQAMGYFPAHYRLANDVDCIGTKTWNGGAGFKPVEGVLGFDGAGHTIRNLMIDRPTTGDVGLFKSTSAMKGGLRGPLRLTNVDITGQDDVGAVAGVLSLSGNEPPLEDVIVTGIVRGRERVGGIMGAFTGSVTPIKKLWFDGEVYGDKNVGGLVGEGQSVTLEQVGATGTVTSTSLGAGGLVGGGSSVLTNTMFVGTIDSSGQAGGLAGSGTKTIDSSYAVVKLKLKAGGNGGGLVSGVASSTKITRSFAVARLVLEPTDPKPCCLGGLAVSVSGPPTGLKFADSYWLDFAGDAIESCFAEWSSNDGPLEGCTSVPEAENARFFDKARAPMLSWTFDEKVWSSNCSPDKGYPVLAFLKSPFATYCIKGPPS